MKWTKFLGDAVGFISRNVSAIGGILLLLLMSAQFVLTSLGQLGDMVNNNLPLLSNALHQFASFSWVVKPSLFVQDPYGVIPFANSWVPIDEVLLLMGYLAGMKVVSTGLRFVKAWLPLVSG